MTQQEFAERLQVSRNYISLIETGSKTPSPHLLAEIDRLLTRVEKVSSIVEEDQAPYGEAGAIEAGLRKYFEELIDSAGGNTGRLGWIREQMLKHVSPPQHWNIMERALAAELEAEREEEDRQRKGHSPPIRAQGGAGR